MSFYQAGPFSVTAQTTGSPLSEVFGNQDPQSSSFLESLAIAVSGGTTPVTVTITGLNSAQTKDNTTQGQLSFIVPANGVLSLLFPVALTGSGSTTISGTPAASQTLSVVVNGHIQ